LVPFTSLNGRIPKTLAIAVGIGGLACTLCFTSITTRQGEPIRPFQYTPQNDAWLLAIGLQHLGLQPNESVASAGNGAGGPLVLGLRLMRARIVAQLDWNVKFWQLSASDQQRVLAALASTGAKFAIADAPPPNPEQAAGWQQVGSSNYYAYSLTASTPKKE
jgi:hypothetical protein